MSNSDKKGKVLESLGPEFSSGSNMPKYSPAGISSYISEISKNKKKIFIVFNHPNINDFAYKGVTEEEPFITLMKHYKFNFDPDRYTYSKDEYPTFWFNQIEGNNSMTLEIHSSSSSFTDDQIDFIVDTMRTIINELKTISHFRPAEVEENKKYVANSNTSSYTSFSSSSNSSSNNSLYKSSSAEITEEEEDYSYDIINLSSTSIINNYQLLVLNDTSNNLIHTFLKDVDVPESITKKYINKNVFIEKFVLKVKLADMFKEKILCAGIDENYIKNAISRAHTVLVIRDKEEKIIYGFAALILNKSSLFIDLICSNTNYKYVGKNLMFIIKKLARYLGMKHIELISVPKAKEFYKTKKFRETKKTNKGELKPMKRRLIKKISGVASNEKSNGYAANVEGKKKKTYKNKKDTKKKLKKED
jgi:hypothetical protein